MLRKVVIFLGRCDFLDIKYEPLSDPPPPNIKICEWGPWAQMYSNTGAFQKLPLK